MARPIKHQFIVPSESSGKEYVVTHYGDGPFDGNHPEWACACIGWIRHSPRRDCKHILWAQNGGARTFDEAIANRLLGNKLE